MTLAEACDVLGLQNGPSLTSKGVKAASRDLKFLYHPDKGGDQHKWLELQEALNVVNTLLEKSDAKAPKPSLDSFSKTRKSRNEWAQASYTMYRVSKWRSVSHSRSRAMLGAQVQEGMLEDTSADDFEPSAERTSRSR